MHCVDTQTCPAWPPFTSGSMILSRSALRSTIASAAPPRSSAERALRASSHYPRCQADLGRAMEAEEGDAAVRWQALAKLRTFWNEATGFRPASCTSDEVAAERRRSAQSLTITGQPVAIARDDLRR